MDTAQLDAFAARLRGARLTLLAATASHDSVVLRVDAPLREPVVLYLSFVHYIDVVPVMHCEDVQRPTAAEVRAARLRGWHYRDALPRVAWGQMGLYPSRQAVALVCSEGRFLIWATDMTFKDVSAVAPGDPLWHFAEGPLWPGGPRIRDIVDDALPA